MSRIKFIESSHQYISDKGELISVSKFFERFKPKVNWFLVAKKKAAKMTKEGTPTTAAELMKKWENKRNQSARIGTAVHSIKERDMVCGMMDPRYYGVECNVQQSISLGDAKYSSSISELANNTIYPELMIYDLENMICGQSDKVIIAKNKINIWDYKTDQEIKFKGFSSEWTPAARLLGPLSKLEDCNGNHYAIKMSLYMYLLWKANKGRFKPGEIVIEHLHLKRDPNNDNLPVLIDGRPIILKTEKIKLPYLKKEVMAMLKTLKKK